MIYLVQSKKFNILQETEHFQKAKDLTQGRNWLGLMKQLGERKRCLHLSMIGYILNHQKEANIVKEEDMRDATVVLKDYKISGLSKKRNKKVHSIILTASIMIIEYVF